MMPAEDVDHERTWMCYPSNPDIWGEDLAGVQADIIGLATVIAAYEPVTLLARPEEEAGLRAKLPREVAVVAAPVDDLWARDTLPNFLIDTTGEKLGAAHAAFNGWGDKQLHEGDRQLARQVCQQLKIELWDSGLTGEGGGLEVDGAGSVLAARSSWVNENRNPGTSESEVAERLMNMVGARKMLWIDGLAGQDITDGHIDTLGRFVDPHTVLVDEPAFPQDDADPWVEVAERTAEQLSDLTAEDGEPIELISIRQPTEPRGSGDSFLSTYMNFYVCNDAVIAPEFGDSGADGAAKELLTELFPDREIEMVPIDSIAAGGGGIHCSTQQQPKGWHPDR